MNKKTVAYAKCLTKDIWLYGVPTRDMTRAEWEAIPEAKRKKALGLGLFEIAKKDGGK